MPSSRQATICARHGSRLEIHWLDRPIRRANRVAKTASSGNAASGTNQPRSCATARSLRRNRNGSILPQVHNQYGQGVGYVPDGHFAAQNDIGQGAHLWGQALKQLLPDLVGDALTVGVGGGHQVIGGEERFRSLACADVIGGGVFHRGTEWLFVAGAVNA